MGGFMTGRVAAVIVCGTVLALAIACLTGCATGTWGRVIDPEQYWQMSGFQVQAPSGMKWIRDQKIETFPNAISFVKFEQLPIHLSDYHPQFTFTKAFAYGAAVGRRATSKNDAGVETFLREYLHFYEQESKMKVEKVTLDVSRGGSCLAYSGNLLKTVYNTYYGPIKYSSVTGYLCLHPDYDDFVVGMESRNGGSEELDPANRDSQLDHFFRSLRFTPRNIPPRIPLQPKGGTSGPAIIS
jgi:hypothetical protein